MLEIVYFIVLLIFIAFTLTICISSGYWCKSKKQPYVIKNAASDMLAYYKWNDKYLRKQIGDNYYQIEKSYSNIFSPDDPNSKAKNVEMTFNDFSQKYIYNEYNESNKKHSNYYFAEVKVPKKLLSDICHPMLDKMQKKAFERNMFLGVGGNITRTHFDSYDNYYFLLDGTKEFYLISPKYNDSLYIPKESNGEYSNYLNVDIENIDYDKYPKMKDVEIMHFKLKKGDMLFIPYEWWHLVKSGLNRNLAVSYWYA